VRHDLLVPLDDAGQRLDCWLEERLPECTRSMVARLIRDDACSIEPGKAKPAYKLRGGERVSLEVPEMRVQELQPETQALHLLYEDDDLLLVDKAPGLVVHPAPGHGSGTLLAGLLGLAHERGGGQPAFAPQLIHRLDEDTSGVIAVAKHDQALAYFQAAFQERSVSKRYLALVVGRPKADLLENRKALGRHPKDFRKRCVLPDDASGAKPARTTILVRERHPHHSVVEARPLTGRTHQVRVHLADLGHAVLADRYYARNPNWPLDPSAEGPRLVRQGLHAWGLELPLPDGRRLRALAPFPEDFRPWVEDHALRPMGWEQAPGSVVLVDERHA
jgi:23S rRNA pseudouridine1911/1915/1917 synthase